MKAWHYLLPVSLALITGCDRFASQPAAPTPAPVAPASSEVGRYQVVVSNEGDRGAILFLVDTKEGSTWVYRPPSPALVNGFWSDIPRVTYPPNYWQSAFAQIISTGQSNAPGRPNTTPATPVPALQP